MWFCIDLPYSQVKLLFAVLTQHGRAGAEYLGEQFLFRIGLPCLQVKLLFMVLA